MHEEDGMILVFMLRRFGSHGEARFWPSSLGWVMRNGPQGSCMSNSRSVRTIDARGSCVGSLSLGVECRSLITWCTFILLREKQLGTILRTSACAGGGASIPGLNQTMSTQAICGNVIQYSQSLCLPFQFSLQCKTRIIKYISKNYSRSRSRALRRS